MSLNKKVRQKRAVATPVRFQGYYTKKPIAFRICEFIKEHIGGEPIRSVMDPSAGPGYLIKGMIDAKSNREKMPILHMVEPTAPVENEYPYHRIKRHLGFFHMTLEEWCLTYAKPQSYDLWLCNPPFNKRMGTTNLGEHCHKLFRSEIEYYETLFFLVGSVVAKRAMAFILPDRYFKRSAEARPTLQRLAQSGWEIVDVRALPLDSCYHAMENMSLLLFERCQPASAWVEPTLEMLRTSSAPPLLKNRPCKTITTPHGIKTGYLLKGASADPDEKQGVNMSNLFKAPQQIFSAPPELTPFDWTPEPRKEGDHWNRNGCIYELTPHGWEPANSDGYCDGRPVNEQFDRARHAYTLFGKGAYFTANAILDPLNLDSLREQYKDINAASFLMLLTKGKTVNNPFLEDLKRLGMLEITPEEEPGSAQHPSIERIHGYLVCRDTLTPDKAARLYLQYKTVPQWVYDSVMGVIENTMIPLDKITLRSPWIDRALVARFLDIKLDSEGLFYGQPHALSRYLNYGKKGPIQEGDAELFHVQSQRFAIAINNWESDEHTDIRPRIHAHYLVANAPLTRVIEAFDPPQLAEGFNLHFYQKDDIPFYLSGATISNLDTGLGKTLTALAASVAYTKGTPRKAFIGVPQDVLMKWGRTIETFFPGTGYHILGYYQNRNGETVRRPSNTIAKEAQKVFWDFEVNIVLTSHTVIRDFKLKEEEILAADTQSAYDLKGTAMTKSALKARTQFIKKSAERNFQFGGELTWSDLPAGLFVVIDEAHNFKNLHPMPSQGWGESLIMAGSASQSKRARDLMIKLDLVRARGGKTLGMTATLISNSVAEIYNLLRIFSPQVLEQYNITNTQHVIDTYCILEHVVSASVSGEIREGQAITGFQNLDQLKDIWDKTTRTLTAQDVGLKIPGTIEIKEVIQPTPQIQAYMDYWKAMLNQKIEDGAGLPDDDEGPWPATAFQPDEPGAEGYFGEDKEPEPSSTEKNLAVLEVTETPIKRDVCVFDIISQIDKVAAHPAQVDIMDENPKLERLVTNVMRVYRSPRHSGGQLIFADVKAVQDLIKQHLTLAGMEAKEIFVANCDTAKTASARLDFADKFNDGVYKVVIGGGLISEGVDLQANTHAAHFINLAWEGATLHQRIGRLVRQGNVNRKVGIYYYILDESTDVYRFLTIQRKTQWIDHLRSSQTATVTKGVFSESVDDEFLVSLAKDKAKMRGLLEAARKEREFMGQVETFEKSLKLMCSFANPEERAASLEILQSYEAKIRALDFIPPELIDEGIRRVQALAYLQNTRLNRKCKTWQAWVRDIRDIQKGPEQAPYTFNDVFLLRAKIDTEPHFDATMEELFISSVLYFVPDFPQSFGNRQGVLSQPTQEQPEAPKIEPYKVMVHHQQVEAPLVLPDLPEQNILKDTKLKAMLGKTIRPKRTTQNLNFRKLLDLVPEIRNDALTYAKLKSDGFMDLNIDVLLRGPDEMRLALSHYYRFEHDSIADPDMVLHVDFNAESIKALTYQDTYGYQEAEGNPKLTAKLDKFLNRWLTNIKHQGHKLDSCKYEKGEQSLARSTEGTTTATKQASKAPDLVCKPNAQKAPERATGGTGKPTGPVAQSIKEILTETLKKDIDMQSRTKRRATPKRTMEPREWYGTQLAFDFA